MAETTRQLEEAISGFEAAEKYFEAAYLTYRLASRHLDEAEAAIAVARKAMNPVTEEYDEIDEDSLND
jgi:exonuclease VII small subunit